MGDACRDPLRLVAGEHETISERLLFSICQVEPFLGGRRRVFLRGVFSSLASGLAGLTSITAHQPISAVTNGEDWQAGASYGTGGAMITIAALAVAVLTLAIAVLTLAVLPCQRR
jgi:hypothetical protein